MKHYLILTYLVNFCFSLSQNVDIDTLSLSNIEYESEKSYINRSFLHNTSHLVVPISISLLTNHNGDWESIANTYLLSNFVDFDHIIAEPIYNPDRCSINFHPLHSTPAILGYSLLSFHPETRDVGTGILIHMGLDYIDCEIMNKLDYSYTTELLKETQPINYYTAFHFLFWYGIGKYTNVSSDEMLTLSLNWETLEFKLPFEFAKENWLNKSVDLLTNIIAYNIGHRTQ